MDAVHPTPELLDDYVNQLLDEPAAARIEEHLADCDECARTCRQLAVISDAWAKWTGQGAEPLQLAAAGPKEPGATRFYVSGGRTVVGALRDVRLESGYLHFTVKIDERAVLPKDAVLEVIFLDTLETAAVPLPASLRRRLGRVGLPCSVDVPPELRRRLRGGLDSIAFRIRGAER